MPTDDITLPGTGEIVATDYVGSKQYQYVKIAYGINGTATLASNTSPLPILTTGVTGLWVTFEDTSFTADVTLDLYTGLGNRKAVYLSITNDGVSGDPFTVKVSNDGAIFSDSSVRTMQPGEVLTLTNLAVHSIKLVHSADSAYRVLAY